MHKLTNRQILILALFDESFQVDPDLQKALKKAKALLNQWVCDAYNCGGLFFDPTVEAPKIVDAVLEARRDICGYCTFDTTDVRIGHNCGHCGCN
jgi:hypothetical protein